MELHILYGHFGAGAAETFCATLLEMRRGDFMQSDSKFATLECFKDVMKPLVNITKAHTLQKPQILKYEVQKCGLQGCS